MNPKTIRYYESIGLLPEPERTPTGYRDYGHDEVGRLAFIRSARRLGLSLDEIREVLAFRDRGEPPCGFVLDVVARQLCDLDKRICEMVALRGELSVLLDKTATGEGSFCALIERHTTTVDSTPATATTKVAPPRGD